MRAGSGRHTGRLEDSVAVPTRLLIPQPHEPVVERTALLDRLCGTGRSPLVLIAAPAGWGKTTLAAQVARREEADGRSVAWLSMDEGDTVHDLVRDLIAALRLAHPMLDLDLRDVDLPPDVEDVPAALDKIMTAVAVMPEDVTVFLDDVHLVEDPAALAALGRLLGHAPRPLRVVMTGRSEPDLPINRWRMTGVLADIGPTELAVDAQQAGCLVAALGVRLADLHVNRLVSITEGWVGGIRLAARSLAAAADPQRALDRIVETGGVGTSLADYLIEQVIKDLPAPTQDFLRDICVINPIPVELAERLSGRADARVVLREVSTVTGFVAPVDPAERSYRMHQLLAAALRYQLAGFSADRRRALHREASRWFADRDRPLPAARQAIMAQDWHTAGDLLLGSLARLSINGAVPQIRHMIADVPRPILLADPVLAVLELGCRAWMGDYGQLHALLATVDTGLEHLSEAEPLKARQVRFVRIMAEMGDARADGRYGDSRTLIEEAAAAVGTHPGSTSGGPWDALVASNLGTSALWTGDLAIARRALGTSAGSAERVGYSLPAVNSMSLLSWLDLRDGRLSAARTRAESAVAAADRRGWTTVYQVAVAYVVLAGVAVERGLLSEAKTQLGRARSANRGWSEAAIAVLIAAAGIRVTTAEGQPDEALAELGQLRQEASTRPTTALLEQVLTLAEVDALVTAGRYGRALDRISELEDVDPSLIGLVRARRAIEDGDFWSAVRSLSDRAGEGAFDRSRATLIRMHLWRGRAHQLTGQHRRAVAGARAALDLADREGYRLPFLEMREHARPLLELVRSDVPAGQRALLAGLLAHAPAVPDLGGDQPHQALTSRERELLAFLPTRMTNEEIADQLGVSVNTIKSHVRSVYRKLDVPNRREAVRRAEQAGLI